MPDLMSADDLLQSTRAALLRDLADLERLRDDVPEEVHPSAPGNALRRVRELFTVLVGRDPEPAEVDAHR